MESLKKSKFDSLESAKINDSVFIRGGASDNTTVNAQTTHRVGQPDDFQPRDHGAKNAGSGAGTAGG